MIKQANTLTWQQELKKKKLDHIKAQAPGFFEASGGYSMIVHKYSDFTTEGLGRAVMDWINYSCGSGSAKRMDRNYQVHAVVNGREVCIAVIGRYKLNRVQIEEQDRITTAGGLCFTARSMASFVEWFKKQDLGLGPNGTSV